MKLRHAAAYPALWGIGIAIVGLVVFEYPALRRNWRENTLKTACDLAIGRQHAAALKDYQLAGKRYESDLAAYGATEAEYEKKSAEYSEAKKSYEAARSRALASHDFKNYLALHPPVEPSRPFEPSQVSNPEDPASLPSIGPLALVSVETKAVLMNATPDPTCIRYVGALLDDPTKAEKQRLEIELAHDFTSDKTSRIESGLDSIADQLNSIESQLSSIDSNLISK
jgi:hypothetical protein